MKISSLEIQWCKWHLTPTSYEQIMNFQKNIKLKIYFNCLKFNSSNLHKNHSSSRERRVKEEMAHQVWHMERRRWRKAQKSGSSKRRGFFAIRIARNMFGNLDEDGSRGFDAKGEMNELVQSSK
jgi:hypothetical protein